MRVLVDTNVFLDFFLKRDDGDSEQFFLNCYTLLNSIYVTSLSLRDIEYTIHRALHSKELSKKYQRATYSICDKVIVISADAAIESLYSNINDYEDSLQIEAAKEALLDCIVTNNKKDYSNCGIPIFTPKEINVIWGTK